MKKAAFLAVTALAAAAHAEPSSLTLFGVIDTRLALGKGSIADTTRLGTSGQYSSRLGFRGNEDLGGGWGAGFWLEADINSDDGTGVATNVNNQTTGTAPSCAVATTTTTKTTTTTTAPTVPATTLASTSTSTSTCTAAPNGSQGLVFNRRSTVSLFLPYGEIRIGRDYTPTFWNPASADPFGNVGGAITQMTTGNRAGSTFSRTSNGIAYHLPTGLWGIYGQVQRFLGENASSATNAHDGSGLGIRLGWTDGRYDVAIARTHADYLAGDINSTNARIIFRQGPVKLSAAYGVDKVQGTSPDGRSWLVGGVYTVGASDFKASYSVSVADAAVKQFGRKVSLGYVYNLSKRTSLYASVARIANSGGASFGLNGSTTAANTPSRALDLGISHSF